jgi:hypothetical protein
MDRAVVVLTTYQVLKREVWYQGAREEVEPQEAKSTSLRGCKRYAAEPLQSRCGVGVRWRPATHTTGSVQGGAALSPRCIEPLRHRYAVPRSPLLQRKFWRLVIDEAQVCRSCEQSALDDSPDPAEAVLSL